MEVVAFVRYQLRARDERLLFDDVISASCTLDLDDAFMGSTRLRLASEGAVRRNLAAFQEALCAAAARGALGRG